MMGFLGGSKPAPHQLGGLPVSLKTPSAGFGAQPRKKLVLFYFVGSEKLLTE